MSVKQSIITTEAPVTFEPKKIFQNQIANFQVISECNERKKCDAQKSIDIKIPINYFKSQKYSEQNRN